MKNIFQKEIQAFDVFDKNGKRLIMVNMMFAKPSIGFYIIFFGFFSGAGGGFYWSNRQFLSFLVTNEENRNFFASLDQFFKIFFESFLLF